ncbi:TonB-dependent receptor, partial [Pseudoalteromonas phenolica]
SDSLGASITAGAHHHEAPDVDDDGRLDMAYYDRGLVRPRLYWSGDNCANLYITMCAMTYHRNGGTAEGALMPDGEAVVQNHVCFRLYGGMIFEQPLIATLRLMDRVSVLR